MVDGDTGLFWRFEHWLKRFSKPYLDEPGDFVQQLDSADTNAQPNGPIGRDASFVCFGQMQNENSVPQK